MGRWRTVVAGVVLCSGAAGGVEHEAVVEARPGAVVRERISVVALAWEEELDDVPYGVDRITASRAARGGAGHGVPDAIEGAAGVAVQRTSAAQASPYLRGFTGFRTLLLLDGVRLNSATFRDGPNQYWSSVDPALAETLDVARGPYSVLYGSDAVGGTVDLRTPELFSGERFAGGGGQVILFGATADRSGGGHLDWSGGGERFRFELGATLHTIGDLEAGGVVGRQPETGFDQASWSLKGEYRPIDRGRLVVAAQADRIDDAWRTHRTIYAVPWRGTTAGTDLRHVFDQARDLAYLRWIDERPARGWDGFEATLSWTRLGENLDRVRGDGRRNLQSFDAGTIGGTLRFHRRSARASFGYGADLSRERVDSASRRFRADASFAGAGIQGRVAGDAVYELAGFYAQSMIAVAERLAIVAGGRWTYAAADARRVQDPVSGRPFALSDSWSETTGDLRLLVPLGNSRQWRLWAGIAQSFRAPNLSDLTRLDLARSNEIETPSPDLRPERFLTYEVGVRRSGARGRFEAVAFWNDLDGLIVRTPTGRTIDGESEVTKRNAGDGRLYGVELRATRRLGSAWSASFAGSWQLGDVVTFERGPVAAAEPIDKLPPAQATLELRHEIGQRAWLGAAARWADVADRLSVRDRADTQRIPPGGTPGYVVVDLHGELQLSPPLRLGLTVENLFDTEYRVHGSGQNGAGRGVAASLHFDF